MLLPEDRVIVGVSGGADSVCLLHILLHVQKTVPVTFIVVHIEHGIRGEESLADARFVEELAKVHGLEFCKFSYDVLEEAKKAGLGTEEMARTLRYKAFEEALTQFRCNKIAVAHNKNDNAETLLLNLFRGSGLKGLGGIMPVRDNVIRPLLCVERSEIEAFLEERDIEYRMDKTNLEDDYTRNKIRLNVLPYIQENVNKQAVSHIDGASKMIYEAWEYLEAETDKVYKECVRTTGREIRIEISRLLDVSDILKKNIIRKCIGNAAKGLKDITNNHVESILGLFSQQTGREIHLPYGVKARKSYGEIIIGTAQITENLIENAISVKVPGVCQFGGFQFEFSLEKREKNQIIPEKIYTKWFDYDKIGDSLRLRTRETGDYFAVNSGGDTKKLKSYFIDEKIEREKRDSIPVLSDNHHIIWIVGYRISEAYKVDENTKQLLKVQVNGG